MMGMFLLTAHGNTKPICDQYIGDDFLKEEVKEQGILDTCSYCGEVREAIMLDALADRIHDMLHEHFRLTPGYPDEPYEYFLASEGTWERRGDPVEFVIAEMAGVEEDVTRDVISLLSARYGYWAIREEGREDPYGPEAMYEERRALDLGFQLTWAEFRREIQSRSRFFSAGVEEMFADIFGDLTALKTPGRTPVIREINPEDQTHFVWRGRTAQSPQDIETILKSPVQELGPPPSRLAKTGRMNAQGISVFYGATKQSTCVSELRPLVGGSIVIGRFELLRSAKLLDLGALSEVYVKSSYFDPEYAVHKARTAFLHHLVSEISRPILPEDELLEYLPTQVVAEYLAQKAEPHFDGIIYPSSQRGGNGENVVLFNHSSRVEPYSLPAGSSVEVDIPFKKRLDEDDDFYDGIWVSETVPSNIDEEVPPKGASAIRGRTVRAFMDYLLEEPEDDRNPALRLDTESVEVLDITAARYKSTKRSVIRNRQTKEERDSWEKRFADIGGFDLDDILDN